MRKLAAICGAAIVTVVAAIAFAQAPAPRTVRDGVFTAAQVERGRLTFAKVCAECHEIEEFTAADAYLEEIEGDTVWDLFDYVWSEMPEDYPSSLEPAQYADVLAYIFSVWGHPAGEAELATERAPLDVIVIARPERPGS